ncbi:helix-turn-helix domain-containing protein [Halomarina halobia]|uniref:Helix-turn-helix domain-containing protein n=1 Tax=Halomarina halobia TaxID=3033386 RepID=A0ABD6ADV0_9EURY|nr:helix-turn-helix domain-containing protein [Halomarina sp. PSR21]
MSVATFRIPAGDLALERTFETIPDLRFEMAQVVAAEQGTTMSFVRVWGPSREDVEAAFELDPSVAGYTVVSQRGDSWLYELDWESVRLCVLREILFEGDAMILSVKGRNGSWVVQVMVLDRNTLSRIVDNAWKHDFSIDVVRITELDSESASPGELTQEQYETLMTAVEEGYFEIPRRTTMEELAEKLGITHQALSERFRRGHQTLIETSLEGQPPSFE